MLIAVMSDKTGRVLGDLTLGRVMSCLASDSTRILTASSPHCATNLRRISVLLLSISLLSSILAVLRCACKNESDISRRVASREFLTFVHRRRFSPARAENEKQHGQKAMNFSLLELELEASKQTKKLLLLLFISLRSFHFFS